MTMFDPYANSKEREKAHREQVRQMKVAQRRGLWNPDVNEREASTLPPWVA